MNEALLNDSAEDLLPYGTKKFYSKHQPEPRLWALVFIVIGVFLLIVFVATITSSTTVAAWGVAVLIIAGIILAALFFYSSVRYERQIKDHEWMQGIFLFASTGDVVIRFHGVFETYEYTLHRHDIEKLEIGHNMNLWTLKRETMLILSGHINNTRNDDTFSPRIITWSERRRRARQISHTLYENKRKKVDCRFPESLLLDHPTIVYKAIEEFRSRRDDILG